MLRNTNYQTAILKLNLLIKWFVYKLEKRERMRPTNKKIIQSSKILELRFIKIVIFLLACFCLYPNLVFARSRKKAVKKTTEPVVRVKIGKNHWAVKIQFPSGGLMKNSKGRVVKRLRPGQTFSWAVSARKRRQRVQYRNQIIEFQSKNKPLVFNTKPYRGSFFIKFASNGAVVVNHLGIEDYLRGVVGREMGSGSPSESLKAQAVIARTYAYTNKSRHGKDNADICNTTHCQVYGGVSAERKTIDKAVLASRGIVMTSDGKAVSMLYHATCGGMTSDNDKVWGGRPRTYLRRVSCPFCKKGTNYRWKKFISTAELRSKLSKEKVIFRKLNDVTFNAPGHFDRVDYVLLKTDRGDLKVKGTTFRRVFKLPSTTFLIAPGFEINHLVREIKSKPKLNLKETVEGFSKSNLVTGVKLATVGNVKDAGPKQFAIYSKIGLKRVQRPEDGWKVIIYRKYKLNVQEIDDKQSIKKLETNVVVRKVEQIKRIGAKSSRNGLDKIEIYGRGYGHQVGLCQSGAIEMGRENWSYRQILAYYYSDVALRHLKY